MTRLFVVALTLLRAIGYVSAQTPTTYNCSLALIGDSTSCYAHSDSCHYIASTGVCAQEAPASCTQYITDAVGCNSASFNGVKCAISSISGLCQPSFGTALDNCQAKYPSQADCVVNGCYWDLWLSNCWNSLAAVTSFRTCAEWTSVDASGAACFAHGCDWVGGACVDTSSGEAKSVSLSVNSTMNVDFANAKMDKTQLISV
jgi:hypothetical protein